jgi:hypothetical protein
VFLLTTEARNTIYVVISYPPTGSHSNSERGKEGDEERRRREDLSPIGGPSSLAATPQLLHDLSELNALLKVDHNLSPERRIRLEMLIEEITNQVEGGMIPAERDRMDRRNKDVEYVQLVRFLGDTLSDLTEKTPVLENYIPLIIQAALIAKFGRGLSVEDLANLQKVPEQD